MKISPSLLLGVAFGQYNTTPDPRKHKPYKTDSNNPYNLDTYDTDPYNSQFPNKPNKLKNDGGQSYGANENSANFEIDSHFNGLYCWSCESRLDLGTETETTTDNAYTRCLKNGFLQKCSGEQRACLFEERRRHGVIYSLSTGCKQTDACLAQWRRNQRFTLPFMNFGDMSVMHLSSGRPIYIDNECSTYQETRDSDQWDSNIAESRTNFGISYAKFSYDTASDQANTQLAQWESSCRWCCASKHDTVCNLDQTRWYSSPFATKCGSDAVDDSPDTSSTVGDIRSAIDLSDNYGGTDDSKVDALVNSLFSSAECSLSNARWSNASGVTNLRNRFQFFQAFSLSDPFGNTNDGTGAGAQYIQDFVATPLNDLANGNSSPVTGEGRNSMPEDKYKGRGNSYASSSNEWQAHKFEHQGDMTSQEDRDSQDQRVENA